MGEFIVDKTTGDLIPTAGMPDTYPASQVTYGNGSVEDALDAVMPRTASGTTLAQLNDAFAQLTDNQRRQASIWANNVLLLQYVYKNRYQCVSITTTNGKIQEYRIILDDNPTSIMVESNGSTVTQTTFNITSWILYYQGTPIS